VPARQRLGRREHSLGYVREICLGKGISFGGNLQLTSVLLLGKPIDAQRNAIACLEAGGERGFVLSPGCDLPYATPLEKPGSGLASRARSLPARDREGHRRRSIR